MAEANPYRLPRTVEPERYELTLTPDIGAARFTGEEHVQVRVHRPTSTISLNAAELEIFSAELISPDGEKLSGEVALDAASEVATITLAEEASPGAWTLHLTFAGTLNDKLQGFYRSTFTDDDGNDHVIATTQFEATDARKAFPCWDEPDFKAVFSITLIVDDGLAAFSNSPVVEEDELGNGKRQVTFADTMRMSTYIVAFVVGPLVVTEPVDVDGVPLRVACVPGREHLTPFALEVGAAALRYFAQYFKLPYPADKLDMIALPDFAAGAMENLGCVTFRETALLVDVERASRLEIERVADVVAHEIAHMWFGDLVTMKWWNGIWLNEAFATFMEMLLVDHFRPEWKRWVSFGLSKSAAMNIDSLTSTRPIEFEVVSPEDAEGMFDLLTYEKGAAVLRMLEQHLGDARFAAGIAKYLHDNAHGNAETTDLWDALEASTGEPVRAVMDSWIFQGGHPIVTTELADDGRTLVLTQDRFLYQGHAEGDPQQLWKIPVGIRAMVDNELRHERVLMEEERIEVPLSGEPDWFVVNEHANGFFRVSYSPDALRKLVANVHALEPLERFALASDTWAACLSGTAELSDVLALVSQMKGDDDPNVWGALLAPLRLLEKVVDDESRAKLEAFVREIARPQHEWLGWTPHHGEGERLATLRGTLIEALGALGNDAEVRSIAAERYAAYRSDPSALDANLVNPVQAVLAAGNDAAHYELLHSRFTDEASTPQEKVNALVAIASFTEPALVERTLQMILDGEVRSQDAPYAIRTMLTRRGSAARVWAWCEEHWTTLTGRFPDNSVARMLEGVTAQTDADLAARVQAFMAEHPIPQAEKGVAQTCERLRVNVAFAQRIASQLDGLLA